MDLQRAKRRKRKASDQDSDCVNGKEISEKVSRASVSPHIIATKSVRIPITRVEKDTRPLTEKELELIRRLT